MMRNKESIRFLWSHESAIHRGLVRLFNSGMRFIPFWIKYEIGRFLRRNRAPYFLIRPGMVLVQIGAPQDTLLSGRSRAMYFCLLAGSTGKVVVIEPDEASVKTFKQIVGERSIKCPIVANCAAWSSRKNLKILVNPAHPASNFISGTKSYDEARLSEYKQIDVPADTVDNILRENQIDKLDLISITTNGSEREILRGTVETIARGVELISLARTGNYLDLMYKIGYELYAHDDRGYTFRQKTLLGPDQLRELL